MYLTSKFTSDLYNYSNPEHPAAHARMKTMLICLDLMGLGEDRKKIETKWNELMSLYKKNNDFNYDLAYPNFLLELIVVSAIEGIKEIGVYKSHEQKNTIINSLLNSAWIEFWKDPILYNNWEKEKVRELKQIL